MVDRGSSGPASTDELHPPTSRIRAARPESWIVVGPGSAGAVLSLSFTADLAVTIPAVAIAATAARSPRRDGLLVAAALIAAAAIYPICALIAVLVWPLYLCTSRRYWLASPRRRWLAVVWTAGAAPAVLADVSQ